MLESSEQLYEWSWPTHCCNADSSSKNFFLCAAARSSLSCLFNFIVSILFSITEGASSSKSCKKQEVPYLVNIDLVWLAFFFSMGVIAEDNASSAALIFFCSSKDKRFFIFLALFGSTIRFDTGRQSHEFTR